MDNVEASLIMNYAHDTRQDCMTEHATNLFRQAVAKGAPSDNGRNVL